jgi:hypothetical protein
MSTVTSGLVPLAHLDMTVADGCPRRRCARSGTPSARPVPAGSTRWWAVHTELVEAGYSPSEADVLVEEMVARLAERQPMS